MKLPLPEYDLGSIVYARIDPEKRGMVTGYIVRSSTSLVYLVTWAEDMEEKESQEFELTDEKGYSNE